MFNNMLLPKTPYHSPITLNVKVKKIVSVLIRSNDLNVIFIQNACLKHILVHLRHYLK